MTGSLIFEGGATGHLGNRMVTRDRQERGAMGSMVHTIRFLTVASRMMPGNLATPSGTRSGITHWLAATCEISRFLRVESRFSSSKSQNRKAGRPPLGPTFTVI